MKKTIAIYIVFIFTLHVLCYTYEVNAAEVRFVVIPSNVEGDTATIIEAYISPQGASLNAIEGVIGLFGSGVDQVSKVVVETGDSAFNLWLLNPVYSSEEKTIRFTGGSTKGISDKALIFRMRIFSKGSGEVTISWLRGEAYQNDGQGTPEGISSRSLVLSLAQNEPNPISSASADSIPPYFDTLLISQDPDMFEGKYFLNFHATDDLSGVTTYEVVEDQVVTKVYDGIYVLRDQERKSKVVVIAHDQAGNSTSVKVPEKYEWIYKTLGISLIFILMGIFIMYLKIKFLRK